MNANTVLGFFGGTGRNQIGSQVLASTTETEFKVNQDAGANNAIAVITIPQGNEILGASNPLNPNANAAILGQDRGSQYGRGLGETAPWYTNTAFDLGKFGARFRIRLQGFATAVANAANSFTLKVYSGTSKAGTAIGTITGATASAASLSFNFNLDLQWDSTQQVVCGMQYGQLIYNGTSLTFNAGTAATPATVASLASLNFCATVTWGNAVGGTTQCNEFVVESL